MAQSESKKILRSLIPVALKEMHPSKIVSRQVSFDPEMKTLSINGESVTLEKNKKVWILGSGKASASMARALESILGDWIRDGLVITPAETSSTLKTVQLLEGAHPIPDKNSLAATYELIHLAEKIPEGDLVLYLLSGGSSALLCMPAGNLDLEDLTSTHRLLLHAGADIHEMNVIRTVLSGVKGGQILQYLSHTRLVDLIISDVPGDEFRTIGSGPTTPGILDYDRAFRILKEYELWRKIPHEVRIHIARGMHDHKTILVEGQPLEHRQFLVSSASMLAEEVAGQCRRHGYEPKIIHPAYNLPIEELETLILEKIHSTNPGKPISRMTDGEETPDINRPDPQTAKNRPEDINETPSDTADSERPHKHALIFYGESSVNVTGSGNGGRNQEISLRIARQLTPGNGVTFASVGTDGVDGPTDAAGAIVDGYTTLEAERKGLDPDSYLKNNDSWHFFDQVGGHIKTGPTGNNLMDLQVILIE